MRLMEEKKISGLSFLAFPFLGRYGLFCGFTSRNTGFSQSPYDSLNLAYHVGDDRETVGRNRRILLKKILNLEGCLYSARQVHGNSVIEVRENIKHLDGDIGQDADGLMTGCIDVPVMVMGADCMLMVFADIKKRAVCAVHAGWKGTQEGMAARALETFSTRFGSGRDSIMVFIGPGIRQCCYEVGDDLVLGFAGKKGAGGSITCRSGRRFLDLAGLNRRQAQDFGILPENIFDTGICTCCSSQYFSYRREKVTGRQAAVAMVYNR
jgi:polyphenol oxidase